MFTATLLDGYVLEVRFNHVEDFVPVKGLDAKLEENANGVIGWVTVCTIECGDQMWVGHSYCYPTDNFDKSKGRWNSFRRALSEVGLERDDRAIVYNAYMEAFPKRPFPRKARVCKA